MAVIATSSIVDAISGRIGGMSFIPQDLGITTVAKSLAYTNPTPSQLLSRSQLAGASAVWASFDSARQGAWATYALTITKTQKTTGKTYHPKARSEFVALWQQFRAFMPHSTPPLDPPVGAFTPTDPVYAAVGGSGSITFTPAHTQDANTITRISLQGLDLPISKPNSTKWKWQAFLAAVAGLPDTLGVLRGRTPGTFTFFVPGWYAVAYQVQSTVDGRLTDLIVLPAVQVT